MNGCGRDWNGWRPPSGPERFVRDHKLALMHRAPLPYIVLLRVFDPGEPCPRAGRDRGADICARRGRTSQ
ncbi:protein of unknown function [Candidatus Hydrogenisulfobacillus filiaventi]|uniref:Uncharacterized protein n=1 Tax=Candidatus Hydrogenisulfobacillus filiaventi TaxID=2707344 RepID=A0A6F8ZJT0_9FIRM|nr:protein of unknown function [Candidatus Hydrogenisulfobacillus filiaventi]